MKYLCLLFLLFSCSRINAQVDIPELDRLLKYGEVESIDVTFQKIQYSKEFIDKFNLNSQESELIGFWDENYTVKLDQTGSGVRILGINIYPNRIIGVNLEYVESGRRIRALLNALWKMESRELLIKPVFLLNAESDRSIFSIEKVVKLDSQKYYNIGQISSFEKAYVLREQFDFSAINSDLKNLNFKLGKDSLRYRLLFEHAMPSIYERIGIDERLRKFLLNPVYSDPEYYRELERSHSEAYKTDYNKS